MSTFMCLHFRYGATKLLKRYTAFRISFMSCCLFACLFVAPVADIRFSWDHTLWLPLKFLYQHSPYTVGPMHSTRADEGNFLKGDNM